MRYDTGKTNPLPTIIHHPSEGCISQRTCTSCGAVIADSICMCIGIFDCPRCGEHNDQSILGSGASFPPFKIITIGADFPDDLAEIISKLTKEEAEKLLLYLYLKDKSK